MKKFLVVFFWLLCLFLSCTSNAQVVISEGISGSAGPSPVKKNDLLLLKASKTIMILPDYEENIIPEINEVIKKKWTITEIEAVTYSSLKSLPSGNYSYFEISGISGDFNAIMMRLIYNDDGRSWIFGEKTRMFAYFFLSLTDFNQYKVMNSINLGQITTSTGQPNQQSISKDLGQLFYKDAKYYNLSIGHLSLYLDLINSTFTDPTNLKYGKPSNYSFMNEKDPFAVAALAKDTLYIPDYILKGQKFSFGTVTAEELTKEELLSTYPYPYKIIPAAALDQMITDNEKPSYFLDFIMILDRGYFTIYNSQTSEVIYAGLGKSVARAKDFEKLAGTIAERQ